MKLSSQKTWTLWLLAMVTLLTVAGFGDRLLNAFNSAYNPDRLAAASALFSGVPTDATPITLIAVDEQTRENWGETASTPHDALAKLVGKISSLQPKAILLDFDLSAVQEPAAQVEFQRFLENYDIKAAPLFLVKRVQFKKTFDSVIAQSVAKTPYDHQITERPQITWVTTLNNYDDARIVQSLRLWQSICGDEQKMILPSATLAVSALDQKPGQLQLFLNDQLATDCNGTPSAQLAWPKHRAQTAAIPYLFGELNGVVGSYQIQRGERGIPAVIQLRAGALVSKRDVGFDVVADVHAAPFKDRFVLIGATHADSSDIYQTPLGAMPGVVILANSLVSANAIVNSPTSSPLQRNVLSALMVIFFVAMNRWFIGVLAATLTLVGVALFLFLTTKLLGFSSGVESIAVGISGFALFKFFDGITQLVTNWPRVGWRSILK